MQNDRLVDLVGSAGRPRRRANRMLLPVEREVGLLPARAREREGLGGLRSLPVTPVRPDRRSRRQRSAPGSSVDAVLDQARWHGLTGTGQRTTRTCTCSCAGARDEAPTLCRGRQVLRRSSDSAVSRGRRRLCRRCRADQHGGQGDGSESHHAKKTSIHSQFSRSLVTVTESRPKAGSAYRLMRSGLRRQRRCAQERALRRQTSLRQKVCL